MIKGLAITPPILGRISIGRMIERMANAYRKRMTSSPLLPRFKAKKAGLNIHWMISCEPMLRIKSYVQSLSE
jgi:hypothetical protein